MSVRTNIAVPITPKKIAGVIHGSWTCADHPKPHNPAISSILKIILPMTVEMTIGMTMTSRNSGSKIPPFRRVMNRQIRSETFPDKADPNTPPTKGEIYNNPTDKRDKLYGLGLALQGRREVTLLQRSVQRLLIEQ
jgi:hypothetical protein